ncbi:MAG: hypothetical protein ABIF92_00070, partial [archaeon]
GNIETRLAASIVPTKLTADELPDVIEFCKKNTIFPKIGELENAGRARAVFDQYYLTQDELLALREKVESVLGYQYCVATCPAAIASIHITNTGDAVVNKVTSLSCDWFLLNEPDMVKIGSISENSLSDLNKKLRESRKTAIKTSKKLLKTAKVPVFSGCGGKTDCMLKQYLKILESG